MGAVPVAMSRWRCRLALGHAARGRPGTPGRAHDGPGKCRGTATCAHDPVPDPPPDDSSGSNTLPGCDPTSGALHSTPAGRTKESEIKFLLRDHAPPQLRVLSGVVAKKWHAGGAPVAPRRARLWWPRPGAVWPAAWPPASAGPIAGIRGLGSNAGSNAAVCTCAHSPCAGTSAVADAGGRLAYDDGSPREVTLPRDSPGRNASTSRLGHLFKTGDAGGRPPVYPSVHQPNRDGNGLSKARPRRRSELNSEGNSFRNARRKDTKSRASGGSHLTIGSGSLFLIGPTR